MNNDITSAELIRKVFSRMGPQTINRYASGSRTYAQELNLSHGAFDDLISSRNFEIDPLPFVLSANDREILATGLSQWARIFTYAYRDLYGPQSLVQEGFVPAQALWEQASFNPNYSGVLSASVQPLALVRLDVVQQNGIGWRVTGVGTGSPHGLGRGLETRIVQNRVFGTQLPRTNLERLAPFFQALKNLWLSDSMTHRDEPSVMVWTGGPSDPNYFEHGYLARYFGYPLVESRDLSVRSGKVYLKLLGGMQVVDVLVRMLGDDQIDPLAGVQHGAEGVAGLLQAVREGNVLVTNVPGSDILGHPALLPCFQAASTRILGHDLMIPLALPNSQPDTDLFWRDGIWVPHPISLSVFAIRQGDTWEMLPGGLARGTSDSHLTVDCSGIRKDVWVMSSKRVPFVSLLPQGEKPAGISRSSDLPSRVADDLFWLGRYAERAWTDLRYLEKWVESASEKEQFSMQGAQPFLRDCVIELEIADEEHLTEEPDIQNWRLGSTLSELDRIVEKVRDRFSLEAQRIIIQFGAIPINAKQVGLQETMDRLGMLLAAFNGITMESMTRSFGWRFLDMGRRLERASLVLESVAWFFSTESRADGHLSLLLELFDSIMTYRFRYRLLPQAAAVLDLLLLDETNPRSVAYQIAILLNHVQELPSVSGGAYRSAEERIAMDLLTRIRLCDGGDLAAGDGLEGSARLGEFLNGLQQGLEDLSEAIHNRYLAKIEALKVLQAGKRLDLE